MTIKDLYQTIGGNYEDAQKRLMSDKLIERFLLLFPEDPSYRELIKAVDKEDYLAAFKAVHSLKGVAGNLSLDQLYSASSILTESLRYNPETISQKLLDDVIHANTIVIDGITEYKTNKV